MSTLKTVDGPTMSFRALCLDCKTFHDIRIAPGTPLVREMASWEYKHRGHRIEFNSRDRDIPRDFDDALYERIGKAPWFLDFKQNNNFQFAFVNSVDMTYTSLDNLASDATLLAGASALAVDNGATACPLEIGITAKIKNNATPPSGGTSIEIFAYTAMDDTPTYPDTLDGADDLKTITTALIQNSCMQLMRSLTVSGTGSQVNPMSLIALGALFGVMPRYWSVFIAHSCGQPINTSGNKVTYKGVYVQG
jgi:hypothetical protein